MKTSDMYMNFIKNTKSFGPFGKNIDYNRIITNKKSPNLFKINGVKAYL